MTIVVLQQFLFKMLQVVPGKRPENKKFVRRKSELPHDRRTANALADYKGPEEFLTSSTES